MDKFNTSQVGVCNPTCIFTSIKILHTADWHLGKRLVNYARLPEQQQVMEEICQIADDQQVDAVVIAGDCFDAFNPPTEAVELFYKTVKALSHNGHRPVLAIAGNHDSPDLIEAPHPLARECGIILAGYPHSKVPQFQLDTGLTITQSDEGFVELKTPKQDFPLRVLLAPYANEYRLRTWLGMKEEEENLRQLLANQWNALAEKYCDDQGVNILLSHHFMIKKGQTPPEEPEEEKSILHVGGVQQLYTQDIPNQIQYTALGHLHRAQVMDEATCPVVYSGSPLCYSFSEAQQQKQVVIVDLAPGQKAHYSTLPLTKGRSLERQKFGDIDTAVTWLTANRASLIELTIVSDNYLKAEDRKRLQQAHDGIITLIPEITNHELFASNGKPIDLSQDMDQLFQQYFSHKHGQEPNDDLVALFKEVRAENREA